MKKFRELSVFERIKFLNLDSSFLSSSLDAGLLDEIGENPIGFFELPLRILNGLVVNGKQYNVPMVTEEASVVAGACYAAKLCSNIKAGVVGDKVVSQLLLSRKPDFQEKEVIKRVNSRHSYSKLLDIESKKIGGYYVLNLLVNSGESMGAAVSSKMAEEVAEEIKDGIGGVISNKAGRLVEASAEIPFHKLKNAKGIELLSKWAEEDESRAVTNNKGIMNGVTAVALATGQDTRAIEAACHYLASGKKYSPLSKWRIKKGKLHGEIKLSIPCGIKGGELKTYPKAQKILNLMKINSSNELAEVMASVGLVQNLAALNMLATIGITKGHGKHRRRQS